MHLLAVAPYARAAPGDHGAVAAEPGEGGHLNPRGVGGGSGRGGGRGFAESTSRFMERRHSEFNKAFSPKDLPQLFV